MDTNNFSSSDGIKEIAEQYLNHVYLLFLDILDQNQGEFTDGADLIDKVFELKEYDNIKNQFLKSCSCPNKENMLDYLKYLVVEYGCDTIEKSTWLELAEEFEDCLEFLGDDDLN